MQDMETRVNTETGVVVNTAKEYVLAEKKTKKKPCEKSET